MANFTMPEVAVGDLVNWYDDPINPSHPVMGWVIERPGRESISILVFTQSAGFMEKKSVRHVSDPFWKESEMAAQWQKWGAFDLHPNTKALKELQGLLVKAKIEKARGQTKEAAA